MRSTPSTISACCEDTLASLAKIYLRATLPREPAIDIEPSLLVAIFGELLSTEFDLDIICICNAYFEPCEIARLPFVDLEFLMAIDSLHQNWITPCPIALVRKGPVIQALATKALRVGELVVPLFLKKQSSVVTEDEGATIHPKAVGVVVTWWTSAIAVVNLEDEAGSKDVDVRLKVQPELKLPTKGAKGLEWTQSDAVHPFWFIQRADKN